jgi:hypothetical protein
MHSKIISISVTNDEYNYLLNLANKNGLSISRYCKLKLQINNEFEKYYKTLQKNVEKLSSRKNLKFYIRDLWNIEEWDLIPKGVKLTLGKQFYTDVILKHFKFVNYHGYGIGKTIRYIIV